MRDKDYNRIFQTMATILDHGEYILRQTARKMEKEVSPLVESVLKRTGNWEEDYPEFYKLIFDNEPTETEKMKRFYLERSEDVSGVSGTGRITEGIQWSDGSVAVRWPTKNGLPGTGGTYDDIESVIRIHGHGELTKIVWVD